jgi:hypothetical protein
VHDEQDILRLGMPVTVIIDKNEPDMKTGSALQPSDKTSTAGE